MLNKLAIILSFFTIFSCHNNEQVICFPKTNLSIKVNTSKWEILKPRTIDVNLIELINSNDTINIIFGKHSIREFEEYQYPKIDITENQEYIKQEEIEKGYYSLVLSATDKDQAVHLKNYFYYDTVCNHIVKVMLPKKFENELIYGFKIYNVDNDSSSLSIFSTSKNKIVVDEILEMIEQMKLDCK